MFNTYLELGFNHISDISAYDHMLFIIALCAIYQLKEWRTILILVTAFTVGHSLTLGLSALNIIQFPTEIIEFLIPLTILITSLYNVLKTGPQKKSDHNIQLNYFFALFFGLIHGMGFSNFLKASLMPGEESRLFTQLLAFNIGIELGQLIIVASILVVSSIAFNFLKVMQKDWNLFISGATAGISATLMMATWPL